MTSLFTQRIDGVLKAGLTPALRARGFRKERALYIAELGEVSWLVDIQKSRLNDPSEAQFTVNGGVYVPGVVSGYLRRPDPKTPKMPDCCLSVRIGMLDESRLDKWWKVAASDRPDADDEIALDVRHRVESQLLPFLERFASAASVAEFLERPMDRVSGLVQPQSSALRHTYASLIYAKLGDNTRAGKALDQAIREAKGSPIEDFVKKVRVD